MTLENDAAGKPALQKSPIAPWVRAVLLSWCVIAIASQIVGLLLMCHVIPDRGSIGRGVTDLLHSPRPGYMLAEQPLPGSPLAKAGIVAGDELRYDRPSDWMRLPMFGERLGLTVSRRGGLQHLSVVAESDRTVPVTPEGMSFEIAALITSALGLLIFLRTKDRPAAAMLGVGMVSAFQSFSHSASIFPAEIFPLAYIVGMVVTSTVGGVCGTYFVITWFRPDNYRPSLREWVLMSFLAIVDMASTFLGCLHAVTLNPATDQPLFQGLSSIVLFGPALVYMWLGWRRSDGQQRSRTALFIIAVLVYFITGVANSFTPQISVFLHMDPGLIYFGQFVLLSTLAPALLTYSILVDRVLDIGFVINRTLVFAVLSALLLVAFGIIEWAVDHFVPAGWRETNVFFDAALAVVVFLTFHRVRDAAEKAIEGVFFRKWQTQAEALRRFVREASFAQRSETLTQGFAAALTQYTDGAEASIYLLGEDGTYHLKAGARDGENDVLDPDDPAVMSLRAEPKPLRLDEGGSSSLKAALAAPMAHRNEVIGLALLEPRPSGTDFRPDEIELIGWATHQIGLDLHALRVEQLELKVQQLELTAVRQLDQISTLRSFMPQSA